ncbi:holo-ACP synthase [[Mycoplasma] testudinis]|uniref:holo-ACP synthase n=1 Tax=[Mycoplasma] testudinis TaxID=33924 RepID=UPI0004824E48|nr:holo-ACP synthase [[Mycoplasma] testudinis]
MILGIGIDVVNIKRIASKKNLDFVKKLLTASEFKKYQSLTSPTNEDMFLAVRWALKEAIYKSLKTKQYFSDLEIKKINGLYECFIDDTLQLHLSVSYESDTVTAICLAERI